MKSHSYLFVYLLLICIYVFSQSPALYNANICCDLKKSETIIHSDCQIDSTDSISLVYDLVDAIQNNRTELAKYLISKGADINALGPYDESILSKASRMGNIELVKILVEKGADLEKGVYSALLSATNRNNLAIVKYLINSGADVNSISKPKFNGGKTALMLACENGHHEIALYLIHKGADINKVDNRKESALSKALKNKMPDLAIGLVNEGANVNQKCEDGNTPLMLAVIYCDTQTVMYLISKGAIVQYVNNWGQSPLSLSLDKDASLTKYLVEHGADVNHVMHNLHDFTDVNDYTLLMVSVSKSSKETIQYLIDKGADVNKATPFGRTALMNACAYGNYDAVEVLLKNGADINIKLKNKWTALDEAERNVRVGTDPINHRFSDDQKYIMENIRGLITLVKMYGAP